MDIINLKPGDEIVVKIIFTNTEGDGVANHHGYVFYVPDALPKKKVRAKVLRIIGKMVYAEMIGTIADKNETKS